MAQFALYHYELSAFRNKEPRLFVINDPERSYDSMEQLFESFLPGRGSSLNVLEPKTIARGIFHLCIYVLITHRKTLQR